MGARLGRWICAALAALPGLVAAAPPADEYSFAELDGHRIRYFDRGTPGAKEALVFVHGWSCDASFWKASAGPLSSKYRTIAIDLPGHGGSDRPPIAYTMDLYAQAIDAVLRAAKVDGAVLIGHSNGTPAIRQFYRKFPEKTRALVIVDGPLRPFGDRASMEKFISRFKGPGYEQAAGKMIDGMTSSIADAQLREQIRSAMLATPQAVALSEFESTLDARIWAPDKITVPVLMVLAKQPAWNAEYEEWVRGLVPDLEYQVWEGVSHFLMMEQPERFNAALVAFLEKHNLPK
jgi:pimeloyl-ACP methyl ester carboxylesterase